MLQTEVLCNREEIIQTILHADAAQVLEAVGELQEV
jgi:hypothetical protein